MACTCLSHATKDMEKNPGIGRRIISTSMLSGLQHCYDLADWACDSFHAQMEFWRAVTPIFSLRRCPRLQCDQLRDVHPGESVDLLSTGSDEIVIVVIQKNRRKAGRILVNR